MQRDDSGKDDVKLIKPPTLHAKLNPAHLDFSDPENPVLKDENKHEMKLNGRTYNVYVDYTRDDQGMLGEGGYGAVWLAQDAETKEWIAVKEFEPRDDIDRVVQEEYEALQLAGEDMFEPADGGKDNYFLGARLKQGNELYSGLLTEEDVPALQQNLSILQQLTICKNLLKATVDLHKDKRWVIAESEAKRLLRKRNDEARKEGKPALDPKTVRRNAKRVQIIHRDLKPENSLIDFSTLKVEHVDFGFAKRFMASKERTEDQKNVGLTLGDVKDDRAKGTTMYMAPELFEAKAEHAYDEKTEIYALGMMLANIFKISEEYKTKGGVEYHIDHEEKRGDRFTYRQRVIDDKPPEMSESLFDLVKSMTGPRGDRPSIIVATQKINQELHKMAIDPRHVLKVAEIKIDELLNLNEEDQEKFIEMVLVGGFTKQPMNIVALTSATEVDPQNYYKAKHILESHGVLSVAPGVFQGENSDQVSQEIKKYYDGRFSSTNTRIYRYDATEKKLAMQNVGGEVRKSRSAPVIGAGKAINDDQQEKSQEKRPRSTLSTSRRGLFTTLRKRFTRGADSASSKRKSLTDEEVEAQDKSSKTPSPRGSSSSE